MKSGETKMWGHGLIDRVRGKRRIEDDGKGLKLPVLRYLVNIFFHPSSRRWLDIILISFVAVILIAILKPQIFALSKWFSKLSSRWSPLLSFSSLALITGLVSSILLRLGSMHRKYRLVTMFRYPPFWFAVFICIAVLCGIEISNLQSSGLFTLHSLYGLNVVCISVLIAIGVNALNNMNTSSVSPFEPKRLDSSPNRITDIFDDDGALIEWIQEDKPIKYPNEDVFGLTSLAKRIARLLLIQKSSGFGVVGSYGSGKSSLLNLIEFYLMNKDELQKSKCNRHEFCTEEIVLFRIDGWGRQGETVSNKILGLAIEHVKQFVDCTSIIFLPENYRKALSGVKSPGMAVLAAMIQPSNDPLVQLYRLDNILMAARLRLVFFLEDLDRNTADEIMSVEIPALLDRLRALKQVSFVLTIGTENQYSEILIRICDYHEAIA